MQNYCFFFLFVCFGVWGGYWQKNSRLSLHHISIVKEALIGTKKQKKKWPTPLRRRPTVYLLFDKTVPVTTHTKVTDTKFKNLL